MSPFTVILRYPDRLADDVHYVARVEAPSAAQAARKAKTQALRAQSNEEREGVVSDDFFCVAIVHGHPAVNGGDDLLGYPLLFTGE